MTNEYWASNYYYQSEHVETSLTHLCGSQENMASLDDLKALQSVIGTLQWPTTSSGIMCRKMKVKAISTTVHLTKRPARQPVLVKNRRPRA